MQSSLPRNVVALVPCYNAGMRLRPVIEKLRAYIETIYVVDDGSTDGCVETIAELGTRIIPFETNRGKGNALQAGLTAAIRDPAVTCVACIDADGQHDPAELPHLYEAFERAGADMLIGSRVFTGPGVPLRSRFGNLLTVSIAGLLLGKRVPDTQSGYRLLSRRLLENLLPVMTGARYEYEMEMLARAVRGGFQVVAEPIATIYETGNPSSHFRKIEDSWRIYKALLRASKKTRPPTS